MSGMVVIIEYLPGSAEKVCNTSEMRNFLAERAKTGLAHAQAAAPVFSGDYRASLAIEPDDQEDGTPGYAITAGTDHWSLVEFGSINNDPQHILGEAAASVSGKYEDAEGNPL